MDILRVRPPRQHDLRMANRPSTQPRDASPPTGRRAIVRSTCTWRSRAKS